MSAAVLDLFDGENPPESPGPTFTALTRDQLNDLPGIDPLLVDTLDRRTLNVLAGLPGSYKTFTALAWACSVATGVPWEGRRPVGWPFDDDTHRALLQVLYIAAEDAAGLIQRRHAWEVAHGVSTERLHVITEPINLLDDADVARLVEMVGGQLAPSYEQYDLVVIDTLSRCTPGVDENSARAMSLVVAALDRIKRAREYRRPDGSLDDDNGGVAVLAIHHTDKAGRGLRGSNVLEAAADTIYRIATIGHGGRAAILTRTKRKNGPREDTHTLTPTAVSGTESIILRGLSTRVRGQDQNERMTRPQELLSVLVSAFDDGAPTKAELRTAANMPPASFDRALKALVSGGLVQQVDDGDVPRFEVIDE